jgi:hypothetical protein
MPTPQDNNTVNNRFTRRRNTYEHYPPANGVYTYDQISQVQYDAFGIPFWTSPTGTSDIVNAIPRDGSNVLTVDVQRANAYANYALEKSYPNVNEDILDDVLDEEWSYFGPDLGNNLNLPGITGDFLVPFEINLPVDFHDAYIQYGPARIRARLTNGEDSDTVVSSTFCVYFIQNNRAYPIPNYKTLEVMLVENGKTYSDIKEASVREMNDYDMRLDGTFLGDQTGGEAVDSLEEFNFRTKLDRSNEWSAFIRYTSGYRPGGPFKRDPGDYIKPDGYTGTNENNPDLFTTEDPNDMYFDTAFQLQTYKEKLREQYEGKMIIYNWPVPYNNNDAYVIGDINNALDDISRRLRIMVHGYWKQVTDPVTIQLYATANGYDLSALKTSTNVTTTTTNEVVGINGFGDIQYATTTTPTLPAGDILDGENGLINLLVNAGGITVITDLSYVFAPVWNDFPHIVDVDDVGPNDYLEYLDYWSNGGDMFNVNQLRPYEPRGSVAYYPLSRILILQQQLVDQYQIDAISSQISQVWLQVATNFTSIENILNSVPNNITSYTAAVLGPAGDIYKVLNASDKWKFVKRKRNDDLKVLDDRTSFLKLLEKNNAIFWKFSRSEENKIVYISEWGRTIEKDRLRDLKDSNAGEWAASATAGVAALFAGVGGTAALIAAPYTLVTSTGISLAGVAGAGAGAAAVASVSGVGILVVAGAAAVWGGLQAIMGEALDDKYELPRNKFIYPSAGDRMSSLMNEGYTDAMILNQTGPIVNQLYANAIVADQLIVTLRAAAVDIRNVLNNLDERIATAEGVGEFNAILSDLTIIQQVVDSYNSTAMPVITSAKLVVDTYAKQQMQKYYTAIEYVRQKVYNEVLVNNSRGIQWPDSARAIVNKYLPGKTFDNYIP